MAVHENLTGIKHNRVMVFPQGVFSKASLKILSEEGYVAAVNSTAFPINAERDEIKIRDLLEMAALRFGGVALFLRHYPDRMENLALDLFLGKQALLVEHHGFFKAGYEGIERCVRMINTFEPGIEWTDLEDLCTSACLTREVDGTTQDVQVFGHVCKIKNFHNQRKLFRVQRRCEYGCNLKIVTWDGHSTDFVKNDGMVRCNLELDPGQEGILIFKQELVDVSLNTDRQTLTDRTKVFLRRHLSEIRDNYLSKSSFFQDLARIGKGLLPRL
jgi:hypothetical protein